MDDEDEEDGFFVPHGYLSDGEGELDDNETAGMSKVTTQFPSNLIVLLCMFLG